MHLGLSCSTPLIARQELQPALPKAEFEVGLGYLCCSVREVLLVNNHQLVQQQLFFTQLWHSKVADLQQNWARVQGFRENPVLLQHRPPDEDHVMS